jgi:hypothetical protein
VVPRKRRAQESLNTAAMTMHCGFDNKNESHCTINRIGRKELTLVVSDDRSSPVGSCHEKARFHSPHTRNSWYPRVASGWCDGHPDCGIFATPCPASSVCWALYGPRSIFWSALWCTRYRTTFWLNLPFSLPMTCRPSPQVSDSALAPGLFKYIESVLPRFSPSLPLISAYRSYWDDPH